MPIGECLAGVCAAAGSNGDVDGGWGALVERLVGLGWRHYGVGGAATGGRPGEPGAKT